MRTIDLTNWVNSRLYISEMIQSHLIRCSFFMLIANVLLIKNVSTQHACAKHKNEQHAILFAQEKMPSAMDDYDIHCRS